MAVAEVVPSADIATVFSTWEIRTGTTVLSSEVSPITTLMNSLLLSTNSSSAIYDIDSGIAPAIGSVPVYSIVAETSGASLPATDTATNLSGVLTTLAQQALRADAPAVTVPTAVNVTSSAYAYDDTGQINLITAATDDVDDAATLATALTSTATVIGMDSGGSSTAASPIAVPRPDTGYFLNGGATVTNLLGDASRSLVNPALLAGLALAAVGYFFVRNPMALRQAVRIAPILAAVSVLALATQGGIGHIGITQAGEPGLAQTADSNTWVAGAAFAVVAALVVAGFAVKIVREE